MVPLSVLAHEIRLDGTLVNQDVWGTSTTSNFVILMSTNLSSYVISMIPPLLFCVLLSLPVGKSFLNVLPSIQQRHRCFRYSSASASCHQAAVPFQHSDIHWKIALPPETPEENVRETQEIALQIKQQYEQEGQPLPPVLVPQGAPSGQVVLEAWYSSSKDGDDHDHGNDDEKRKIGRFGFTTQPGPPLPLSKETLQHVLTPTDFERGVTVLQSAALIYMWVDPSLRQRQLGTLALEIIRYIHGAQGCDLTVLVADDDGSGKLVSWYEQRGFCQTPELQELLGSPNKIHGVAMVGPTNATWPPDCVIQWW